MSKNQISHNNHYIPQFYLKNWSEDGKTVYAYSLLVPDSKIPYWRKKSIKSTAVWSDFYTRNEGADEIDDFEKWFDREFESPVKIVYDKLLSEQILNKEESMKLTRFIAAQYLRTPARLNALLTQWHIETPKIFEKVVKKMSETHVTSSQIHSSEPQTNELLKLLPVSASVNKDLLQVEVKLIIGKGMYLFALKHLLTETVKVMEEHKWHVIHAADRILYPTSDDPVICMNFYGDNNYDFKGGWGVKNGNIIMPISPKLLLLTEIGNNIPIMKLDYSEQWSTFFRRLIIEHAHRYVYAIEPQKGMLAINPRRVNKALYEKEKEMMAGWHEEQMKEESKLR